MQMVSSNRVLPEVMLIWQATHDGNVNFASDGAATFIMQSGRIGGGLNISGAANLTMTGGELSKLGGWTGTLRMYGSGNALVSGGTVSNAYGYGIESQASGGTITISGNAQVSGIDIAIMSMGKNVVIEGGAIYGVAGVAAPNNRITMTGGTVTVLQNGSSIVYGLECGDIEFSGGTVNVTNNSGGECLGIRCRDTLKISGNAALTVINNSNSETRGIEGNKYVEISGGNVSVTGSSTAQTFGVWNRNGNQGFRMTGGTVAASGGSEIYGFFSRYQVNISGGSITASGANSYGGLYDYNLTTVDAKITGGTVTGNTGLKVMYGRVAFLTGTVQGTLDIGNSYGVHCAEVSTLAIPSLWDGAGTGLTSHDTYQGSNYTHLPPVWDLSGSVPKILFRYKYNQTGAITSYLMEWGSLVNNAVTIDAGSAVGNSNTGSIGLNLASATEETPVGSFDLQLPEGITLDAANTALSSALSGTHSITATVQANNIWTITITETAPSGAPQMFGQKAVAAYQNILTLAYAVAPTVANGTYTAHIQNLLLTFTDASTITAADIPVEISVQRTTGIENVQAAAPMKVFPNPAKSELNVELERSTGGTLALFDLNGKTVLSRAINGNSAHINMSALPAGNYILRLVESGTASAGVKVVKE
jgi:hypothetical protein